MPRFILVVLLIAVAVYLLVRFIDRRRVGKAVHPKPKPKPGSGRRTIAPDDDDQFLRDLDKKRKDEPPAS